MERGEVLLEALLILAAVFAVIGIGFDLFPKSPKRITKYIAYLCALVFNISTSVVGAMLIHHQVLQVPLGLSFGVGQSVLRLNSLSGIFLLLTGVLGTVISGGYIRWIGDPSRKVRKANATGYLVLLISVALIFCAGDAFSFMFAWELLTLAFYILTSSNPSVGNKAGWITAGFGKISGAALLLGFLALGSVSQSLNFTHWVGFGSSGLSAWGYILILIGFGVKVGILPFNVWLPRSYPAAEGPSRAAMAGLASTVGFYGIIKFLLLLGRPPEIAAIAMLILGGLTAIVGISFAAVESNLARIVSYSSVENAGIIFVALGVAMTGSYLGNSSLMSLGLLGGLLQIVTHAFSKSILFLSSSFLSAGEGVENIDELTLAGTRNTAAKTTFALSSLALAGLPPTIGFVSEWFVLESLMQEFRVASLVIRLSMIAAGALVSLTAGLAALAFIRIIGFVALRRVSIELEPNATYATTKIFGNITLLAGGSLLLILAALAPIMVRVFSGAIQSVNSSISFLSSLSSPLVLQPEYQGFSILSPSWLMIELPIGLIFTLGLTAVLSRGSFLKIRRVSPWRSASSGVDGPNSYSAFGYANPIRHVLRGVLGTRMTTMRTTTKSRDSEGEHDQIIVQTFVSDPIAVYIYRPGQQLFLSLVKFVKRFQSGKVDTYISYMLALVIAVLLLIVL